MDITGSVCNWGDHPQRDLPRHPATIAAVATKAQAQDLTPGEKK